MNSIKKMGNYRVLFFGTWGYGRAGLEGLLACPNVEIVKVFTKWDENQPNVYMDQVKKLAQDNKLPCQNTAKDICSKTAFTESILACEDIDIIISCCYDRIFKAEHLNVARMKALNVHPSLLPKYRGIKPLENAMLKGEKETGITIHELTVALDAGDIVLQNNGISINLDKTYEDLYGEQCVLIATEMRRFFANPMECLLNAYPQDEAKVTMAPRLAFEIKNWMTVKMVSLAHWGEWGGDIFGNL